MDLPFRIEPLDGEEPDDLLEWSGLLARELGGLDEVTVERGPGEGAEGRRDGLTPKGLVIGAVVARLSRESLDRVLEVLRGWAARTQRTVELQIGEDWVKVTGLNNAQQDRMIASWLAVHPAEGTVPAALPTAAAGSGIAASEPPAIAP